jgi:hypothetical protein
MILDGEPESSLSESARGWPLPLEPTWSLELQQEFMPARSNFEAANPHSAVVGRGALSEHWLCEHRRAPQLGGREHRPTSAGSALQHCARAWRRNLNTACSVPVSAFTRVRSSAGWRRYSSSGTGRHRGELAASNKRNVPRAHNGFIRHTACHRDVAQSEGVGAEQRHASSHRVRGTGPGGSRTLYHLVTLALDHSAGPRTRARAC